MPARDIYHNTVVEALKTNGWTITHDPLYLGYGGKHLYVDLGAEKTAIAAEKHGNFSYQLSVISYQYLMQ
ncbi:MAG: fatty-acid oxidation protein subunit alpha [Okeania sp. SIO3I5]|uniref:element excision factor XisH family protein n=1 Tax=Okeania sp. SIO3I5 TaxID=2607805 RepID=UPI0013BE3350|nr:element excision factor XisH family protein [Okeania sp. SIO3I5]NEQ38945.1 fatty-acid oxidation protein subunit alpha [Okeania sp. SIO3I5]